MAKPIHDLVQEPRLLLSGSEWDRLGDKLADPYFAGLAESNRTAVALLEKHRGDSLTDVPLVLDRPEARRHDPAGHSASYRVFKNRLVRAAVAWHLDRDQRWLAMARETIDVLVEPASWAIHSRVFGIRHADLKTGDLLYSAAFALDVLGRYLDPARIDKLWWMLRENLLPAYLKGLEDRDWWRHADFNWGGALHGNAGLAALLIEPADPDFARRVLAGAREGLAFLIEALPPGGGWTEGFMYQSTALGHLTDFILALHRLKGEDLGLIANRNLADVLDARPYFILGDGGILNFSNCHERSGEYCLPHAFWWARQIGRPEWTWFEQQHTKDWRDTHGIFHDVEAFWFREPFQPARPPKLARMKHLSGIDWFIWRGDHSWMGFRSGYNGGNHNNLDLGQIIFGAGPDRFLCDPGYGAALTSQHNTVTIRGKEQTDGACGKIFRLRELAGGFYLACDLSQAFPNTLAHYHRHLLLIDEAHLLIVDDILARYGKRNTARYHLQTHLSWQPAADGAILQGQAGTAALRLLNGFGRFAGKRWDWSDLPVHTLSWTDQYDRPHSIHPTLISLKEEAVECRIELDRLTLTVGGMRYSIDLAEGSLVTE